MSCSGAGTSCAGDATILDASTTDDPRHRGIQKLGELVRILSSGRLPLQKSPGRDLSSPWMSSSRHPQRGTVPR